MRQDDSHSQWLCLCHRTTIGTPISAGRPHRCQSSTFSFIKVERPAPPSSIVHRPRPSVSVSDRWGEVRWGEECWVLVQDMQIMARKSGWKLWPFCILEYYLTALSRRSIKHGLISCLEALIGQALAPSTEECRPSPSTSVVMRFAAGRHKTRGLQRPSFRIPPVGALGLREPWSHQSGLGKKIY